MQVATFAAGCFWHVEMEFCSIPGVLKTEAGYTGGKTDNPTYRDVCTGRTGHAESVRIKYDESKVKYSMLLERFWEIHDPTQKNRQGLDIGTQYRSAIFYHTKEQKETAEASLSRRENAGRIVTEIAPAGVFYPAEEYHQKYLEKKGLATCRI